MDREKKRAKVIMRERTIVMSERERGRKLISEKKRSSQEQRKRTSE